MANFLGNYLANPLHGTAVKWPADPVSGRLAGANAAGQGIPTGKVAE